MIEVSERLAGAPDRGRVIADDVNVATALMPLARSRPVVYNAHNLESQYPLGPGPRRAWSRLGMLRDQRRLLELAAESWMVSRADMASAHAITPTAKLRYAPNVVDVTGVPSRKPTSAAGIPLPTTSVTSPTTPTAAPATSSAG